MALSDISDAELLKRAVRSCRARDKRGSHPRWVAVMDVFGLGSTYAYELCQRVGLDPDAPAGSWERPLPSPPPMIAASAIEPKT